MIDFDALDEVELQRDQEVESKPAKSENRSKFKELQHDVPRELPCSAAPAATEPQRDKEGESKLAKSENHSKFKELQHDTSRKLKSAAAPAALEPPRTMPAISTSPAGTLRVQFATLSTGVVEELLLHSHVTAIEVKSVLTENFGIPVAEQRLVAGVAVWADACSLESVKQALVGEHEGPLHVTVIRVPLAARVALSGGRNGNLRVWDIENGNLLRTLTGHGGAVTCVQIHWQSQSALSGSADRSIRRWDLAQGTVIREFNGHTDAVNCLAVAWSKGFAISGSSDNSLRVWLLETGECSSRLAGHSHPVTCVALAEKAGKAVSGSEDRSLLVWDLTTGQCVQECHGHMSTVQCVSLAPDSTHAASGGYGNLKLWQLDTNAHGLWVVASMHQHGADGFNFADLKGHIGPITCVSIDWKTHQGLTGSVDTTLCLWAPDKRTMTGFRSQPTVLRRHTLPIACLAVDWSIRAAVSGAGDCLWVWDLNEGRALHALRGDEDRGEVLCVAMDKLC